MGPRGRRTRHAALPVAAALGLALTGGAAGGCTSPVPFYRPGEGPPDQPVVGLGGPAPYQPPRADRGHRTAPDSGRRNAAPAVVNVYASAGPGMVAPAARGTPPRLYVANGPRVDVVDPSGPRVVARLPAWAAAVVPSWDLRRLWAADPMRGQLVPVGSRGVGRAYYVPVASPAGLYFTPDGRDALVLAVPPSGSGGRGGSSPHDEPGRVDVRDPRTMLRKATVPLPCAAGHADFVADGSALVATCPAAGGLTRVDLAGRRVSGVLRLPDGARPGDLRLSPDGAVFYVADPVKGGLWLVDARRLVLLGFVPAAPGARGLAVSRDARRLFVVGDGVLAAVDFAARRVTSRWPLPSVNSPAPGGVSSDGTLLWLADAAGLVYAVSTRTGRVVHRLWVGGHPTSLRLSPQPGRYSLGGTGLYR
ncbi:YncE family protein [Actinomadura syzygii]|uniref:YncE family protein n=1 Tax=Actinomadura syzygii TaxID=1427538 RepID=A0A5D0TVL8_9ACTN|nr:hypothetical protein [Actinomadura syzygii]TYC09375.1 hypothetical protein FXF65_34535 [Actinomadura syzygii]